MTREEFYKLTYILDSEVLGNFMHGGEASEVIAQFEEAVEKSCILKEEPVSDIDFEQELYKAFGQVKDFTLGMQIAKRFYEMGKQHQEPVSEDLEQEIIRYVGYSKEVDEDISTSMVRKAAHYFADWQKEQMERNRIAHCKSITNEQAELEDGFVSSHIEANHRMPTFLDAIEYGMELRKKEMLKDAIPAEASWYDGWHITFDDEDVHDAMPAGVNDGDKVKLIIVRED